jgi:ATP-dependent DNA ligase
MSELEPVDRVEIQVLIPGHSNQTTSCCRFYGTSNSRTMPHENQDHTSQNCKHRSRVPNACGIVRHSTLWLRPEAVAQIAFLEWIGADHLRYTKFVALRDDKDPEKVVRET